MPSAQFAALFGGVTAFGSMGLAQRATAIDPVTERALPDDIEPAALPAGDGAAFSARQRTRAAEQR